VIASAPQPARKPVKGKPTFICPFCGRGGAGDSHKDGMQIGKGGMYKCYTCANGVQGAGGGPDIIDLYRRVQDISFREAVKQLQEMLGTGECKNKPRFSLIAKPKTKVDYMAYIEKCRRNIENTDYYRGISLETLKCYWIGFDACWRNPEVVAEWQAKGSTWQPPATPRLIIPTSRYSYLARRTDGLKDYEKMYEGQAQPFNLKALQENHKAIFVVEGEIDALSFCDVGAMAIGLGGSRGGGKLIEALKQYQFNGRLFLVGDTDGKQDKAYTALCEKVQALGVACEFVQGIKLFGVTKDGNEALTENRQNFKDRIGVFING
jgi:hypothetical protein